MSALSNRPPVQERIHPRSGVALLQGLGIEPCGDRHERKTVGQFMLINQRSAMLFVETMCKQKLCGSSQINPARCARSTLRQRDRTQRRAWINTTKIDYSGSNAMTLYKA